MFGRGNMPNAQPNENGPRATRKARFTYEQVIAAVERDDETGICVLCGQEQNPVEPDARKYVCDNCGRKSVFGAPELLIRFPI